MCSESIRFTSHVTTLLTCDQGERVTVNFSTIIIINLNGRSGNELERSSKEGGRKHFAEITTFWSNYPVFFRKPKLRTIRVGALYCCTQLGEDDSLDGLN